jgi:predicted ABC-type ATPase
MIAQFLCEQLISEKRKFSFETVFSHGSKLEMMRAASAAGFKVYLYFIATNDPLINVERVAIRVGEGGHDVPKEKILKRYDLSLAQLPEALHLAYHAFLFDNSKEQAVMFGEMKVVAAGRAWYWNAAAIPDWFIRSYLLQEPTLENLDLARRALAARK